METRLVRGVPRPLWLLGALVALLLTGACADLRDAVGGEESTPAPEATSTPDPVADPEFATRYIGNTGGLGVSLRSDCAVDARIAGGWADTTEVRLLEPGDGRCAGWNLAEANGVTSWVSERYLLPEHPGATTAASNAPATPSGASGAAATASPAPTSVAPTAVDAPPVPPMTVYGPAAAGASVLVLVDGQPCKTVSTVAEQASATGHLWAALVHAGECNAQNGSSITFALNGASTNQQLQWSPGGVPPNVATGIALTLR